jgi:hypothetical protein
MSTNLDVVPGADKIHLSIASNGASVTLRCETHPGFAESCDVGGDREVSATWLVAALANHLAEHSLMPADEPARGQVGALSTTPVSGLDAFGRRIATLCQWAIEFNQGDPVGEWPVDEQIAVALVLGNHEYLQNMGPGPGYTPAQAAHRLWSGMAQPPADLDAWITATRQEINLPRQGEPPGKLWRPPPDPRAER